MENSSQDVSPFATMGALAGIVKVGFACMVSETVIDGVSDKPSGNWKLKSGDVSSGVVTEEEDGDGGGTMTSSWLSEGRRISWGRFSYGCGENATEIVHTTTSRRVKQDSLV